MRLKLIRKETLVCSSALRGLKIWDRTAPRLSTFSENRNHTADAHLLSDRTADCWFFGMAITILMQSVLHKTKCREFLLTVK